MHMDDKINEAFVSANTLKFVRGSHMFRVEDNGKEPNEWKVEHFANVGTSEEFVDQCSGEFLELIDASHIHSKARKEVKEAVLTVLIEGLIPAFESLKKIRASIGHPMPLLNRRQLYEDYSRVLWHAHKDLVPRAALLLGFDIGFLFQNSAKFEQGVIEFNKLHPSLIAPRMDDFLRLQRETWQNEFSRFRNNYLEHRQEEQSRFTKYYQPDQAEALFKAVWRVMADIFPVFIEANFAEGFSIEEIPVDERDSAVKKRFRYVFTKSSC